MSGEMCLKIGFPQKPHMKRYAKHSRNITLKTSRFELIFNTL